MNSGADDELSNDGIADRIRALLFPAGVRDLADVARNLRVSEFALRRTLSVAAPSADPDVLAAIVWELGVDPNWLLTGVYDATVHRKAAEAASRTAIAGRFRALLSRRDAPPQAAEDALGL